MGRFIRDFGINRPIQTDGSIALKCLPPAACKGGRIRERGLVARAVPSAPWGCSCLHLRLAWRLPGSICTHGLGVGNSCHNQDTTDILRPTLKRACSIVVGRTRPGQLLPGGSAHCSSCT